MDFRQESISGLTADVREGRRTARELTEHALRRIASLNPTLNAFVAVDSDAALVAADAVDAIVRKGDDPGPLAGLPVGVKDTEDARGYRTTYGMASREAASLAERDSVLVARLKAAGAVVVGKTNTPELAAKAETDNSVFGTTRNPWDTTRTPGGSSGGSAAAVASGMVPLATGSDGGGSIRIPSAACGLSGFKPSLGRIPDGGPDPVDWHHLTSRGVLARTTADVVAGYDAVLGHDPTDLRSLPMPEPSWLGAIESPHVPMKVAWSPTLGYADVDPEVRSACENAVGVLEKIGAQVVEVETVFAEDPGFTWLQLVAAYNLRTLESLRGTDAWAKVDPGLVMQCDMAANMKVADLVRAEDTCHLLNLRLVELFHDVRLLVTPTTAQPPPVCGSAVDANWVRFTYPFNMTRSPAGTICAGFTSGGLPVGLQMVGPQHGDLVVLRAMAALEDALALNPIAPV
jgi:aspartyl-tRNA(Asn)/glutamyl-tRNA(Gln) amidotransferase subunit A